MEEIEFKKIHDLTFVTQSQILVISDKIASAQIKVVGIIYTHDNDFYFAPLLENCDVGKIAEAYAKTMEEECLHFQQ